MSISHSISHKLLWKAENNSELFSSTSLGVRSIQLFEDQMTVDENVQKVYCRRTAIARFFLRKRTFSFKLSLMKCYLFTLKSIGGEFPKSSDKNRFVYLSRYGEERACLTVMILVMSHECTTTNTKQSMLGVMQWKHSSSPSTKKFKGLSAISKAMRTVFGDYQGVVPAH